MIYHNIDLKKRCSTQPCTYIAYTSRRHSSRNVQKNCDRVVCKQMVTLSDPLFKIKNADTVYCWVKR